MSNRSVVIATAVAASESDKAVKKMKPSGIIKVKATLSTGTITALKTLRKIDKVGTLDDVRDELMEMNNSDEYDGELLIRNMAKDCNNLLLEVGDQQQISIQLENEEKIAISTTTGQNQLLSIVRRISDNNELNQIINFCDLYKRTCEQMIEFNKFDIVDVDKWRCILLAFIEEQQAEKLNSYKKSNDAEITQDY